jgi:hypothetical protein
MACCCSRRKYGALALSSVDLLTASLTPQYCQVRDFCSIRTTCAHIFVQGEHHYRRPRSHSALLSWECDLAIEWSGPMVQGRTRD